MIKRKQGKRLPLPSNVDADIAIANVPVKISLYHGGELLDEYEDVIDFEFNRKIRNGGVLGSLMGDLYNQGLSTEDVLFTIASEMVKAQVVESLQSMKGTKLRKKAAGHELHVYVKRNGEIKYKMPFKEKSDDF